MPPLSRSLITLTLLASSFVLAGQSAGPTQAQIDSTVQKFMAVQHIPGLSLGIYRDGEILKTQGYGLANVELSVRAAANTIYQTGSVGKQFTATAIMILVEEHKIGLDDPMSKYLAGTPPVWHGVTIRHLLTHTSGIADYTDGADKPNGTISLRRDYTEDQLYARLVRLPLKFQAGEKWNYSNTNYVLLGFIIHKVTGEFYGDFLQQRIFKPLGMDSTRIISERDIVANRAAGYEIDKDGQLKNQFWVSPSLNTTADGALYTNVLDLARWDAALYTEKLLKKSSLEQMWTPVTLNNGKHADYGFGWEVPPPQNGHRLVEHDGAWQGFTMSISRYLDDRLTIVVMTNLDSAHSDPAKIAHSLALLYLH
jgi:CubicO group peptidase (beta-lactamase class C family)